MDDEKVIYQKGKGFVQGLPCRDMSMEEWMTYDEAARNLALTAGIYKTTSKPIKEPAKVTGEK